MSWFGAAATSARRLPARALALLPHWPWYYWAGAGAGLLVLLSTRRAAAEPSPGEPVQPGGAPPTLKLGSAGAWVSFLQSRVGATVSGTFDSATDQAVRAFQSAHGLTADGIVGPMTWGALGVKATAGGSAPAPSPSPAPSAPSGPAAPPTAPTTGNPLGLSALVPEREQQILGFIAAGNYLHQWVPLSWQAGGHQVSALVSRRALAISDGTNRLTVNATFNTAQKVADMIGGAMLTTRIADEMWRQAGVRLGIMNKSWNTDSPVTGGKTDRMYEQSNDLQKHLDMKGDTGGIVANEGKDWVLTRRFWNPPAGINPKTDGQGVTGSPHNSANFGWYPGGSKSPGNEPVIQSIGLAHERSFTDYSQLLRFVDPNSIVIDGVPWSYGAALADPSVSAALQDEGGTIPQPRHPDL